MLDVDKAIACRDSSNLKMSIPDGFEGELYDFQKKDVGYFYFIRKALNANPTGLGKTIEIIALNCLQMQRNQLVGHVQVVLANSLLQWYAEYRKFAPHLNVRVALGTKIQRIGIYNMDFDVLLVSYNTLWRDWEYLAALDYNSIGFDECSFFKNPDTKTFDIVNKIAESCDWVLPMTATPIQNCVVDLWSIYQTLDIKGLLGTRLYFTNRYCVQKQEILYINRRKRTIWKTVGYKNMAELKEKIAPFYVRRRIEDIEQDLPELIVRNKWLDLYPRQRELYKDIKNDVLSHHYHGVELRNKFHALKKTIDGLRTVDLHNEDVSVKLDYIMDLLQNDLASEKVVIFSIYKNTIKALMDRLNRTNTTYACLWGDEKDKAVRYDIQHRFSTSPNPRVILGTVALEMGLNLQAARYMICLDMLYNPARMTQIIGRIRRIGSPHRTNIMINLLTNSTLEEKMWQRLNQRQAISDFVLDEKSQVFDTLSDDELYMLIKA